MLASPPEARRVYNHTAHGTPSTHRTSFNTHTCPARQTRMPYARRYMDMAWRVQAQKAGSWKSLMPAEYHQCSHSGGLVGPGCTHHRHFALLVVLDMPPPIRGYNEAERCQQTERATMFRRCLGLHPCPTKQAASRRDTRSIVYDSGQPTHRFVHEKGAYLNSQLSLPDALYSRVRSISRGP